jgi:hypothetical protein
LTAGSECDLGEIAERYRKSTAGSEAQQGDRGRRSDEQSTQGPSEFMLYSFDVKFEGKNVCRLGNPLFHNKKNIMG